MQRIELQTMQNGAVIELFNEEFRKVLENIEDENTSPDRTRKVTLQI